MEDLRAEVTEKEQIALIDVLCDMNVLGEQFGKSEQGDSVIDLNRSGFVLMEYAQDVGADWVGQLARQAEADAMIEFADLQAIVEDVRSFLV